MAAGEVPETMLKTLECPICLHHYNTDNRQAYVLHCGHSFCKLCVKATADGSTVSCPQCRDCRSISDVKQNFAITSVLETLCQDCTARLKIRVCLHCSKQLCDICLEKHMTELREGAQYDLDGLLEDTSKVKNMVEEKLLIKEEELRKEKAKSILRNNIEKMRKHLDQFQKEQEQDINDIGWTNRQAYIAWNTSIQEQIANADGLLEKQNIFNDDRTGTNIVQVKLECSKIKKTLKEKVDDQPILQEYKLKSPLVCQQVLQMLENTDVKKRLSNVRSQLDSQEYDYGNVRLKHVFGGHGIGKDHFNEPIDVAVAPNGHIYFTDSKNHRVKVYDATFKFVTCFGRKGNGHNEFTDPTGVCVNDENDVFVLDAQRIQMFSSNNKFVKEIPEMKSGNGSHSSHSPVYVVSDNNNLLYVSDANAKCINVCDQDGHFYGAFGHEIFHDTPRCLAITNQNKLIVTERSASNIHMFDMKGYHCKFKLKHIPNIISLEEPRGIVTDNRGNIIVGDKKRILVFDNEGYFMCKIGAEGCGEGQFNVISGIALDGNGHLIVCDKFNHRIQVFDVRG